MVSSPTFYRWGNWGRVERWGQPWSPKQRARESWCAPCSLRSRSLCGEQSCAPSENPTNGSCESLTPLNQELRNFPESWAPEGCTNNTLCQTARLNIAWSKCFMKYFFPFPSLHWAAASALWLPGLKNGGVALPGVYLKRKLLLNTF